MCEEPQTEQQWYAIRVTYSREMAAKSYLDSIGIESYVPMHFAEPVSYTHLTLPTN